MCWRSTGKGPLRGKWVDVNKGDAARPLVRSRYVAMEIAACKDDLFFAATPPLEALRLLLSHAASGRSHGRGGRKMLVMDARKAHLHAPALRDVFVDLPPEIRKPGICGRLKRCLYGARDAPGHIATPLGTPIAGRLVNWVVAIPRGQLGSRLP